MVEDTTREGAGDVRNLSTIKERNATFQKLTRCQKAVAIARDVIKWVEEGKLNVSEGTYFRLVVEAKDTKIQTLNNKSLHTFFEDKPPAPVECTVCAMGAIFAAKVFNVNRFKIAHNTCELSDINRTTESWSYDFTTEGRVSIQDDIIIRKVQDIFNVRQLRLIEVAFECNDPYLHSICKELLSEEKTNAAVSFGMQFRRSDDRLVAIMENIIDNGGIFKP